MTPPTTNPAEPTALPDERFRLVVEASPAGVLIVDAAGTIRLANRQIETWFGYSRNELVGMTVENLLPEEFRAAHVGQRIAYWSRPEVRQMGSGRELRARRRDGTEFPCDISLHPLATAGELQVMVHLIDITERKRLEAERQQQETHRRLRFIVDNLPAGAVYVSDRAIQVNRATEQMTGYARQELLTVGDWFRILFAERSANTQAQYEADRVAQFPVTRVWEITRRDGQTRWIEQTAFRDAQDEVWLLHDITDTRRAQQQVVQAERLAAIGQMMTALAHESRNALQRAQACLEMMELDLEDRPELLNLAQRAQLAVDELRRLYEEVRGYASPLALERREWNLQAICEEAWEQLRTSRGTKEIQFVSQVNSVTPTANVDRHRFGQVIRNILENSISVLPDRGGVVRIDYAPETKTEVEGGSTSAGLRVSVVDNGPGLNAEQRLRIFEPFFTTKSRGTGLGMAIAKRIMEAHGGEIQVGPPPVGHSGTEIILRVPR